MKIKLFIALGLGCALFSAPARSATPQSSDQDSVADAARRARAQQKSAPKAKLVIDNDNVGSLSGPVNVVGQEPAANSDQAQKGADDKGAKTSNPTDAAASQGESYWRRQFASANKKLADDAHELDILQREFNLKQQQYYSDPMATLKQEYTRSDLNETKAKIDDKAAVVEQDKADIANLEDELRKAGGDPGWATPPAQPDQSGAATQPGAAAQPGSAPQPGAQTQTGATPPANPPARPSGTIGY